MNIPHKISALDAVRIIAGRIPSKSGNWTRYLTTGLVLRLGEPASASLTSNCINNGSGWCSLEDWSDVVAPALIEQYRRASGKWHITHAIAVSA